MARGKKSLVAEAPRGAHLGVDHVQRVIKGYVISESELDTIGTGSRAATVFLNLTTTCLGLAIGIATNYCFCDQPGPAAKALTFVGAPVAAALAVAFGIGWLAFRSDRCKVIDAINK